MESSDPFLPSQAKERVSITRAQLSNSAPGDNQKNYTYHSSCSLSTSSVCLELLQTLPIH